MPNENKIVKKIIHAGQQYVPIAKGSKVHFHFQTWKIDKERELLDDSRKIGKKEPMVLVIGHKFKLEVWETIVKLMAVGEVASFVVNKESIVILTSDQKLVLPFMDTNNKQMNMLNSLGIHLIQKLQGFYLVFSYPFVSKTLRELGQDQHKKKHTCTMTLHTEGIGYKDLDELITKPCDLEFIIEILKVERSDQYEREMWQLSIKERIELIPTLREKGNKLYGEKQYDEAEEAYNQALSICEQLMIRERKGDEEWDELNKIKLPILLNYAQCKLIKGDFYAVIEHCNTVLEHDKVNEKALFRRAKAHIGVWNPDQAEEDFKMLKSINSTMVGTVKKELEQIKRLRKDKEEQDKDALKKLFMNNNGAP